MWVVHRRSPERAMVAASIKGAKTMYVEKTYKGWYCITVFFGDDVFCSLGCFEREDRAEAQLLALTYALATGEEYYEMEVE